MKIKKVMEHYEFTNKNTDILDFLYKMEDPIVNGDVNSLIRSHDKNEKEELIEDILLHISDKLSDEDFHQIEDELRKRILKK